MMKDHIVSEITKLLEMFPDLEVVRTSVASTATHLTMAIKSQDTLLKLGSISFAANMVLSVSVWEAVGIQLNEQEHLRYTLRIPNDPPWIEALIHYLKVGTEKEATDS